MKVAVVLFNLGGPDSLAAVRPFLTNLFDDPAIIRLPRLLRWVVARLIAYRREPVAREIYQHLGGTSPILANTEAQARALEAALGDGFKVFIAMRYWRPQSDETVAAVKAWNPDRVVLLPLYPQFSTTTTASSLAAWRRAAASARLDAPMRALCCYFDQPGFIQAVANQLDQALDAIPAGQQVRVLFSAHGLPERIVAEGDPYRWQVEQCVARVLSRLRQPVVQAMLCFQSRVGPLAWLKPSTDDEIRRAGAEGRALIVVPIAFVSEHSETLVELDRDYRRLAEAAGVPSYRRLPTVGTDAGFIAGLADEVRRLAEEGIAVRPSAGRRVCPPTFSGCICAQGSAA
jgi:protoporphyrin/coproporphyrin ferrochelatase